MLCLRPTPDTWEARLCSRALQILLSWCKRQEEVFSEAPTSQWQECKTTSVWHQWSLPACTNTGSERSPVLKWSIHPFFQLKPTFYSQKLFFLSYNFTVMWNIIWNPVHGKCWKSLFSQQLQEGTKFFPWQQFTIIFPLCAWLCKKLFLYDEQCGVVSVLYL